MNTSDIEKQLNTLLAQLTTRNAVVQEKKQSSNPAQWVMAVVLALVSLVGIGVALYLSNKRAKELAALRTKVEQDAVNLQQDVYNAKHVALQSQRVELLRQVQEQAQIIRDRRIAIDEAALTHALRQEMLSNITAWEEINQK